MTINPLSQRDSRWGDITIGHSTSKLKDFGCTITALACLAGTTPDVVNAFLTAVDGFLVDRIIWKKLNETKLGLTFPDGGRHYEYNDVEVLNAIQNFGGVLVEVDYDGVISTTSDRHWVLYIGDHKLIDPWTGTIKETSSYPIVKGYAIIQTNNENDNSLTQEEENILNFLKERNATEGMVREALDALTEKALLKVEIQTLTNKITDLEASHEDLQKQIDELSLKLAEEQKSEAEWQSQVSFANKRLEDELEQNALIDEERKKFKRLYEEALQKFPSNYSWKDIINLIIKKLKSNDRKS